MTRSETERIALAKAMVYLHFGYRVPETFDILSRTSDPLHASHMAGKLNQLAGSWLPAQMENRYRWVLLQPDDIRQLTPAWKLIRLCAAHLVEAPVAGEAGDSDADEYHDLKRIGSVDLSVLGDAGRRGE